MIRCPKSVFRRLRRDEHASILTFAAISVTALIGLTGIVVDIGYVFHAHRVLQESTDAAAMAGAMKLSAGATSATGAASTYSAGLGGKNADPNLEVVAAPTTMSCSGNTGATCTVNTTNPNAIRVTETATVPLFFARVLGFNSTTISTSAFALQAGGRARDTDIIIILDTTASMNTNDAGCGGTRLTCAFGGLRTLLQGFTPPTQQVGLMIFPGLKASSSPTKTAAQNAALEYDCSSSTPTSGSIAAYNASPLYTIVALSSDYKSGSSLNTGSDLVKAARGGASGCTAGVTAYGGVGTFYADAVVAAQTYLASNGRAGADKMIILLGDGDAGASSSNMPSSQRTNQCRQAITQSTTVQSAGTKVVTIGYGSPNSGCGTDSPSIGPCQTLLQMATVGSGTTSSPQWFYSDTASGCHGGNSASNLAAIFTAIGTGVTSGGARLIPSS